MIVKLLTEHHLECLSLKGGCTGWSGSTLVKMSNCWKSRAAAQFIIIILSCLDIFCLVSGGSNTLTDHLVFPIIM